MHREKHRDEESGKTAVTPSTLQVTVSMLVVVAVIVIFGGIGIYFTTRPDEPPLEDVNWTGDNETQSMEDVNGTGDNETQPMEDVNGTGDNETQSMEDVNGTGDNETQPMEDVNGTGDNETSSGVCEYSSSDVAPNIIFLFADDLGFNDVSWNNLDVVTPRMEELARDGIILDQNYAQAACSPSRAALLTGKYPFRIGFQHNVLLSAGAACLNRTYKILPEYLQDLGYSTNYLGKWHMGYCDWECTPTYRGFDTFYGYYSGLIDHYTHTFEGGYDWRDGEEEVVTNNGTWATDLLTQRAQELIANHNCDEPFFLFFSHALPHYPVQVPPNVVADDSGTLEGLRNNYLAMVTSMDESVGDVVDALKDKGLYENSIIVFISDNGGQIGPSSNWPLRGEKASIFEGGQRVPGFVHSPLMTARGVVSEGLIHIVDWFTTLLSLAGHPDDFSSVDGVNQTEMLMSGGPSAREEFVYNIDQYVPEVFGRAGIRMGDYKLIVGYTGIYDGWEESDLGTGYTHELDLLTGLNPLNNSLGEGTDIAYMFDWAAMAAYSLRVRNNTMLFNLMDDPSETTNLADTEPDQVELMRARLDELMQEALEIDVSVFDPVAEGSPDHSDGVWTPLGYCEE